MLDKIILIRISRILTSITLHESRRTDLLKYIVTIIHACCDRSFAICQWQKERKIESVFYTSPSTINYNQRLH